MTTKKIRTEPEAWRYIAMLYFKKDESDITFSGLCYAVDEMAGALSLWSLRGRMQDRLARYVHPGRYAYSVDGFGGFEGSTIDDSREARNARGMAALWLALEAEQESRQ